jgi:hypothetical protein
VTASGGRSQRLDLCVRGGVSLRFAAIVPARDLDTVAVQQQRANRDIAAKNRAPRLDEGLAHPALFIGRHG